MEVISRILEPKDSLNYRQLRLESLKLHPECFGTGYDSQCKLPKLYFEGLIEKRDTASLMIGNFVGGELVGLCGLSAQEPKAFEIIQMYVSNKYRGKSIANQSLELAKTLLSDRNEVSLQLTVYKDNTAALRAYEKAGFELVQSSGNELVMCYLP